MTLFRKCISIFSLLCIYFPGAAQQLGNFDVRKGAAPFFLGSIRSHEDSSIKLAQGGKHEYKGRTEYTYVYQPAINQPYFLGGVHFKNVLLTYVSDTLIRIWLNNMYTPRMYPDYKKRAKAEFGELCKFIKEQWGSPGKRKRFLQSPDKQTISDGLQWKSDGKAVNVALYEEKKKAYRMFDISVTFELSRFATL